MLWWHTRIAEARLQDRLEHLGLLAVKVYVIGCVTHATNVLVGTLNQGLSSEVRHLSHLLDTFWRQYPQILRSTECDPLAVEAAALLPGEEGGNSSWDEAIIWAAAYAFSVARRDQNTKDVSAEVLEALHQSYWSVFTVTHAQGHFYASDEEIQGAEMSSAVCMKELRFQLALLAALEAVQGQPPPYATILRQIGGGQ